MLTVGEPLAPFTILGGVTEPPSRTERIAPHAAALSELHLLNLDDSYTMGLALIGRKCSNYVTGRMPKVDAKFKCKKFW